MATRDSARLKELPGGEKGIIGADLNARASLRGPKDEFSVIYNLWTAEENFLRRARIIRACARHPLYERRCSIRVRQPEGCYYWQTPQEIV